MKKLVLVGVMLLCILSSVVSGEEKLNLDSTKYPVLGVYLEGMSNYAKVGRQNSGIMIGGLGAGLMLGGLVAKDDHGSKQAFFVSGIAYAGAGLVTYLLKSKYENMVDEYLLKISNDRMTLLEREKLAEETLDNLVKEQKVGSMIGGGFITLYGVLIASGSNQQEGKAIGIGFAALGLYSAFTMKTPDEVFLERYKAQKKLDSQLSFNVEPAIDSTKVSFLYNF